MAPGTPEPLVKGGERDIVWFLALAVPEQKAVLFEVTLLGEFGPELGRPHADTLHGAKTKNLKELRAETAGHILRVAFYFSKTRNGILLTGGDKSRTMAKKLKDAIKTMEAMMPPEAVEETRIRVEREILSIRLARELAKLREKCGVTQGGIKNFSQTSVSRIERRKDVKISTLLEYLSGLGMGVEIRTYPKSKRGKVREEVLLRV